MKPTLLIPALTLCAVSSAARAGQVTLTLQNGDDGGMPFNTTFFTLTNDSAAGIDLTGLALTVGDLQYNFDEIYLRREAFFGGDGSQTALLTIGDRAQDGLVTDDFAYTFGGFRPGVRFEGQFDIDIDTGAFDVDSRLVLFNNGAAPNAIATFSFSDGSQIAYTFPDLPIQDFYSLSIPAPGPLAALGGLLIRRSRRAR